MWSVQMEIDGARSKVQNVVLDRGTLFVQTDAAVVHAFDAETGRPIWSTPRMIGDPRRPTMAPAVNRLFVAVVNGSRLYVLNRVSGDVLWQTELDGVVSAAPSLVDHRVLVPLINGRIVAYRLKEVEKAEPKLKSKSAAPVAEAVPPESIKLAQDQPAPLACQSSGEVMASPILTSTTEEEDTVAWPTSTGALLIAAIPRNGNQFIIRQRFLVGSGTAGGLAYHPADGKTAGDAGLVYVVSREGFVYAVNEKTGQSMWEYPVAEAVVEPPVLVGANLYVATQLGGMFCLDAKTGVQRWAAPLITKFVAAGPDRIYAVDKLQQLVMLDTRTGNRVDGLDVHAFAFRLANSQTDRLYLVGQRGLVQCLRDVRQVEPLVYHVEQKRAEKKAEKEKPAVKKVASEHKPAAKPAEGMAVEETDKPAKKAAHKAREPKEPKEPKEKPAKKAKKGKKDEAGFGGANPFAKPKKE
jgi:outer membrane protein assembly factor BamB